MRPENIEVPFCPVERENLALSAMFGRALIQSLENESPLDGESVALFERALQKKFRVAHCVSVGSGTDALVLALQALELPKGSRVAVPGMTFVSSAAAIVHAGHVPVFVDVDCLTGLAREEDLLALIRNASVDAILAVHLYGQCIDLREIAQCARSNGVRIVEDAAQAFGSKFFGHTPGALSDVACLSFDPKKVLGSVGSGGAIITRHTKLADTVRALRQYGFSGNGAFDRLGYNSALPSIQAAFLNVKLEYVDNNRERRQAIASRYRKLICELDGVEPMKELAGRESNFHKFVVLTAQRDALREYLERRSIETKVHYSMPLYRQKPYREYAQSELPGCETIARKNVSLPIHHAMTDDELERVLAALGGFYGA